MSSGRSTLQRACCRGEVGGVRCSGEIYVEPAVYANPSGIVHARSTDKAREIKSSAGAVNSCNKNVRRATERGNLSSTRSRRRKCRCVGSCPRNVNTLSRVDLDGGTMRNNSECWLGDGGATIGACPSEVSRER